MENKRKAAVWDADKQEWTEQEILVGHLVDEKELKKQKRQERKEHLKHSLNNALKSIVKWLGILLLADLAIVVTGLVMETIGVSGPISGYIEFAVGIIVDFWIVDKFM